MRIQIIKEYKNENTNSKKNIRMRIQIIKEYKNKNKNFIVRQSLFSWKIAEIQSYILLFFYVPWSDYSPL